MPIPRRKRKAHKVSLPSAEKEYKNKVKVINEKIEDNDKDYIKFRDYHKLNKKSK